MNILFSTVITIALFAGVHLTAQGVTPPNQPKPNTLESEKLLVEQGGTILMVDYNKRTVNIDGVVYIVPLVGLKINNESKNRLADNNRLIVGMQLRFTASKANYSNQMQLQEVWITKLPSKGNT